MAKSLRIKSLINSSDIIDYGCNVFDSKNNQNNTNENINSIIICLLNEIKLMKTDIFDIRNRVKIIMNKIEKIDKNEKPKINKSNIHVSLDNNDTFTIINSDNNIINNDIKFENISYTNTNKKIIKNNNSKINKQVEKIITNKDINIDFEEEDEDDELEKEFEKYLK